MARCPICDAQLPSAAIAAPDRGQGTPGTFEVAICGDCGAGVTLPLAGPHELATFYPSGYGPHSGVERGLLGAVSRTIRWLQAAMARRRPPLAALSKLAAGGGRGVDVGAGRGDLAASLAAGGWRMTAIEPAAGAVAQMRARGIDALEGVLATVALDPESFDFAVFQHSLEHTIDPVDDLRRAHSALRTGGLVLVTVPNFGSWQRRAFRDAWYHLDLPRHRVHFSGRALERALRAAGFDEVVLHRSSSAVGLPASLQYVVAGRCLFPAGLGLRIAAGLCVLMLPPTVLLDRLLGEGDTLHAVARRPADAPR
jgi:SAM-dependent methyltransferase